MIQQERVTGSPADVATIPEATSKRPRSTPWLVVALVAMTVACLALGGWTLYQRSSRRDAEGLAMSVVAAWDSGRPAALADVYDPAAVLVDATGARVVGTRAIAAAVADRGPTFTMTQIGAITTTSDGTYATSSYRFSGDGHGVGVSVIQIADGRIVRQWTFEPISAPTPPSS
jgi:hypothetical protein